MAKLHEDPNKIVRAIYGSADHPLHIGDMDIPCYVLEDGRRVLVQGQMLSAMALSPGGHVDSSRNGRLAKFAEQMGVEFKDEKGTALARFIAGEALQPFVSSDLLKAIVHPIKFMAPTGTSILLGYEASILADICEAVLQARENGALTKTQSRFARQCEILVRGFARVGIIALVDEATGYQEVRAKQALEEILRKFISDELASWVKTFDDDFYKHLFRLRNLTYSEVSSKRPSYIGKLTNDIVYERLAPGVLDKLREITPRDENGRPKHKYHQRLTENYGYTKLREHLASVTTLMKASPNWTTFQRLLERSLPKYTPQLPLPLTYEDEPI